MQQRFASIMILSVLRHTKSSVKFWFIENFLSPSFLVRIAPASLRVQLLTHLISCRNLSLTSQRSMGSSTN